MCVQCLFISICNKENNWYFLQCCSNKYSGIFVIAHKDPGGLLAMHCTFFLRRKKQATSSTGILIHGNLRGLVRTIGLRSETTDHLFTYTKCAKCYCHQLITFTIEGKGQKSLGTRGILSSSYDHWCILKKCKVM